MVPALTLVKAIKSHKPEVKIFAIGSYKGIEERLFKEDKVPYKAISTGKLRRYFSWQNFLDLFRLIRGLVQAYVYLLKFSRQNTLIFSTGGFVTVPVVFAAWMQGKTVYIHEQTSRVGLANKISSFFAKRVLVTFETSLQFFPKEKTILSGYPLRDEILSPPEMVSLNEINLNEIKKPILFLTGGGNGSRLLNETLKECLSTLEQEFFIIHQCGAQFLDEYKRLETENYKVFDFITDSMIGLLNKAQVVISRAGAGTVMELLSLGKPSIFVPLAIAQKNEQLYNAIEARNKLESIVIEEKDFNSSKLIDAVQTIRSKESHQRVKRNPAVDIIKIIFEEN